MGELGGTEKMVITTTTTTTTTTIIIIIIIVIIVFTMILRFPRQGSSFAGLCHCCNLVHLEQMPMKLKPLSCLGKHSCGTWSFLKSSLEWSHAVVARHAWMLACATLTCFKGLVGSVPPNIICLYTSRCACRGVVTRSSWLR